MSLYVSIECDEILYLGIRIYRDHQLIAEANVPKQALSELYERPLSARDCRIAVAANPEPLSSIVMRKLGQSSGDTRANGRRQMVNLTVDDVLGSGERFSAGPLHAGASMASAAETAAAAIAT
jgi:hypothetical protein